MSDKVKTYRYSEIFGKTIQGEGKYSGIPTVWYRAWGCNFTCAGFGQSHLSRDQWVDPYADVDVSKYKTMEELPVFPVGCDSGYSWSKKFGHLARKGTPEQIVEQLRSYLPGGTFQHPRSKQWTHMAFTGGEPMMSQSAIVDIMEQFRLGPDSPQHVTIETNGTQDMRDIYLNFFGNKGKFSGELFWSVSPKLSASGENWNKAIKPETVRSYQDLSSAGQLKYVGDGSDQSWDEIERATQLYRDIGVNFPVWVMPVGARREEQEAVQVKIAEGAIERGYHVAMRIHVFLFGNIIGK